MLSDVRNNKRERNSAMWPKMTYSELSEKCIFLLLILSMLLTKEIKAADFPVYSLLLLLAALGWMAAGMFFNADTQRPSGGRKRPVWLPFWPIRYRTDLLALAAIIYEAVAIVCRLFQDPDKGGIDFSGNAEVLACMMIYFLISSGAKFGQKYFDLILYGGLLLIAFFLYRHVTGAELTEYGNIILKDTGAAASCFMLVCMVGVYRYCVCKDRLRSIFYLAVTAAGYLALFLNRNIISFWLMAAYFLAIPVFLRPTARLVKRDMQMFFLFGFMLSNMSLLTEYTPIFVTDVSYSLEHSVVLDLLLAAGGILFFHYWEKIPEGVDLERLVMRKMRRVYKILLMVSGILFTGIAVSADRWTVFGDKMTEAAWQDFALPLAEAVKQSKSGFYFCFREAGVTAGIFTVVFCTFIICKLWRNYGMDRPMTGILILITDIFMVQLLFFKPAANTLTVYWILMLFAVFNKEEKTRMISVRIREETLRIQGGIERGEMES